jgi:cytochrome P450
MVGVNTIRDPASGLTARFPLGAEVRLSDLDVDPYPVLARLQREEPVSWVPEIGMWFLTRRTTIVDVLRDAGRFTTEAERSTIRDIFGAHMMTTDGEIALRYKRACLHAFRAETLTREMGAWIRVEVDGLFSAAGSASPGGTTPDSAPIDLMGAIATPLAVATALRVLGLPQGLSARVAGWYDSFALALANFTGDPAVRARGKSAAAAFADVVRPLLAEARPEDRGLLAQLATRREDPFGEDEIIANALIILFGGIETTASMIGNTLWSLIVTGSWADYVGGRWATGAVIEEALRWQPAVQSITRHTTEDLELDGVPILAGSVVQSMIGAANRDEAHFELPDRFDPDRPNASDHLSFGTGRHLCLGAHLARMEIAAVLEALRSRVPEGPLAPEPAPDLRGYEFRRPPALSISV